MTLWTQPLHNGRRIYSLYSTASLLKGNTRRRLLPVPARTFSVKGEATDGSFLDYKPTVAFLFPGQGAQKIGMAKDVVEEVPAARELFERAGELLGYDLHQICVEGPKEKLNSTVISQPALFVSSLAAVEKLKAEHGTAALDACDVSAGLSLGEYTALTFADAMTFEEGLKLVKLRGEVMQAAAEASESAMVSVIGLKSAQVAELCEEASALAGDGEVVKIANFLCRGNYTVSGSRTACAKVKEIAKPKFKARMTIDLPVAGAFHTDFMSPAVEALKGALSETAIVTPRIPVVSNVDAKPHSDPEVIKRILSEQVTSPVQWEQSMVTLLDRGLKRSYELGPGTVISGIFKRINKEHPVETIEV